MNRLLHCMSIAVFAATSASAGTSTTTLATPVATNVASTTAAASPGTIKTLRYASEVAETGFDPAEVLDLYSRNITSNLFDAPLRFAYLAPIGTIEPSTSDGMPEVSSDFKTFTIHLKKGIYFVDDPAFDGKKRELVAEDYVYSYKRIFDPHWNSPAYSGLEEFEIVGMKALRDEALKTQHFDYDRPVEGLKTIDRYTFQIKLGVSRPRFFNVLADPSIMGAVAREVVEKYGEDIMAHPVGTGPFHLVEWHRSLKSVLERNPNYREDIYHFQPNPGDADAERIGHQLDGRRLPLIDRVEISDIEESQPRWLSFLNAEYDFLEMMPRDMADLAVPNNKPAPNLVKKHIQVERVLQIDNNVILFNMDNPVVGGYTAEKVALRRAFSLAFDTPEAIRTFLKMQAIPAQSVLEPELFGYDPNMRSEMGITDVARAKALLDQYGYVARPGERWRRNPDGSPLVIAITTQPDQRSRIMDEVMKRSFDSIDVESDFRPAKWPDNFKAARAGNYMIWFLGYSASDSDPGSAMQLGFSPSTGEEDLSRFKLPVFDELYLKQQTLPDGPERLDLLHQMSRLLIAYMPMKFYAHRYVIDMAYPWVHYYRRCAFAQGEFIKYVDVDTDAQPRNQAR